MPTISTNFGASTLLSQLTGGSGSGGENPQHLSGFEEKPQGFLLTEGLTSQIISMETGSQVIILNFRISKLNLYISFCIKPWINYNVTYNGAVA